MTFTQYRRKKSFRKLLPEFIQAGLRNTTFTTIGRTSPSTVMARDSPKQSDEPNIRNAVFSSKAIASGCTCTSCQLPCTASKGKKSRNVESASINRSIENVSSRYTTETLLRFDTRVEVSISGKADTICGTSGPYIKVVAACSPIDTC